MASVLGPRSLLLHSAPVGTGHANILVSLAGKHRPTAEHTRAFRDKLTGVSPHRVLLPANRHGGPDPELRPALAGRCAGDGPAGGPEPRVSEPVDPADWPRPRHHRSAHPAALNQPKWTVTSTAPAPSRSVSASGKSRRPVTSLSGSFQTSHLISQSADHVSYNIAVQTPQYEVKGLQEFRNFPSPAVAPPSSRRSSATSYL